jgi:hypothetical protein
VSAWSQNADLKAREILRAHAEDLYSEAERTAIRARADTVSPSYVEAAAVTLSLRQPCSPISDLMLAVGGVIVGLSGGVFAAVWTGATPTYAWVIPVAGSFGALGLLLFGGAVTSKFLERR